MARYIHQLENWPNYTYDAKALTSALEEASARRGRLFGALASIGFDSLQERDIEAITTELVKSSAIEGERLDLETVRSSVAGQLGMATGARARRDRYVDGLVEVAIDATKNYREPLTAQRIFSWHSALFPAGRNLYGEVLVGRWRDDRRGPMVVSSRSRGREIVHYEAPGAERLPAEMAQFLDWFEAENEASLVIKAGIAHIWFETLHPLDDGNGRVGRNIMDLMLARADDEPHRPYSVSASIEQDREAYYDVLEASQKGNLDYTPWLDWYLASLSRSLAQASDAFDQALARTKFWNEIEDVEINDRQRRAVSRLLIGWEGKMTNKKYASLTRCSDATATRDLVDLVAKGILRTDPTSKGRSTGYLLVNRS